MKEYSVWVDAILPESTITWFNTEYFNSGDGVNMRNMLLSSQYSTIADILKHLGERTLYQELR